MKYKASTLTCTAYLKVNNFKSIRCSSQTPLSHYLPFITELQSFENPYLY